MFELMNRDGKSAEPPNAKNSETGTVVVLPSNGRKKDEIASNPPADVCTSTIPPLLHPPA